MGALSARIFEIQDAGRLIRGGAGARSRVDVSHSQDARASRRIEVGVKHAAARAKLKLHARPFTDLERGMAKMPNQFLGSEALELACRLRSDGRRSCLAHRLARRTGAGGKGEGKGEDEGMSKIAAHWMTMPGLPPRGNVAAR